MNAHSGRFKALIRWLFAFTCGVGALHSHVLNTDSSNIYVVNWDPGKVLIRVKLPTPTSALIDGSTYASSFVTAAQSWNSVIQVLQLDPVIEAEGTHVERNDLNEIVMASTIRGEAFPAGVLAVTISWRLGNAWTESDIIFNQTVTWDSYRGGLRPGIRDFQRVAIHEIGHLLGLAHPDEATPPQTVRAIMNSTISEIDVAQPDDITGAQTLYGARGSSPLNDRFANATEIAMITGSLSLTGANIGATWEAGEPFHAGDIGSGSAWWRWTPPISGTYTLTTLGSNFDTTLGLYTGSAVNGLTTVASNDDIENGVIRTSRVTTSVTAGVPYMIAVDGWSGSYGQITLNVAYTSDNSDPQGRYFNLSTNTTLSAGEQVVPGFVISGSVKRKVLVRAIGPGLTQFGVGSVLADPTITINRIVNGVATVVATNDNWASTLAPTFSAAGAFGLTAGSTDAAIEVELEPGSYTVTVGGNTGNSGQVIVEVYESNPVSGTPGSEAPSRFFNLSVNTILSVNEEVVPGFVVEGTKSRNVLIRAIGPGLTQFGVGGALPDPTLTLNRIVGGVATVIGTNDNWDSSLAKTFADAGAFGITAGSADAALQVNLLPGSYTVTVKGKTGTSGQVIVEVYEAP